jgi:chemotaxis response regulator CheB
MVQNPESTEYDGMPRSTVSTGLADKMKVFSQARSDI